MERCSWCMCNEKMIRYHDEEWGVPVHDDRKQFEFLMMEVMQCGLNWNMMIIRKRRKIEIFKRFFRYLELSVLIRTVAVRPYGLKSDRFSSCNDLESASVTEVQMRDELVNKS